MNRNTDATVAVEQLIIDALWKWLDDTATPKTQKIFERDGEGNYKNRTLHQNTSQSLILGTVTWTMGLVERHSGVDLNAKLTIKDEGFQYHHGAHGVLELHHDQTMLVSNDGIKEHIRNKCGIDYPISLDLSDHISVAHGVIQGWMESLEADEGTVTSGLYNVCGRFTDKNPRPVAVGPYAPVEQMSEEDLLARGIAESIAQEEEDKHSRLEKESKLFDETIQASLVEAKTKEASATSVAQSALDASIASKLKLAKEILGHPGALHPIEQFCFARSINDVEKKEVWDEYDAKVLDITVRGMIVAVRGKIAKDKSKEVERTASSHVAAEAVTVHDVDTTDSVILPVPASQDPTMPKPNRARTMHVSHQSGLPLAEHSYPIRPRRQYSIKTPTTIKALQDNPDGPTHSQTIAAAQREEAGHASPFPGAAESTSMSSRLADEQVTQEASLSEHLNAVTAVVSQIGNKTISMTPSLRDVEGSVDFAGSKPPVAMLWESDSSIEGMHAAEAYAAQPKSFCLHGSAMLLPNRNVNDPAGTIDATSSCTPDISPRPIDVPTATPPDKQAVKSTPFCFFCDDTEPHIRHNPDGMWNAERARLQRLKDLAMSSARRGTTTSWDSSTASVRSDGSIKVQMPNSESQSPGTIASHASESSVASALARLSEADRPPSPFPEFTSSEGPRDSKQSIRERMARVRRAEEAEFHNEFLRNHFRNVAAGRLDSEEGRWSTVGLAKALKTTGGAETSARDTGGLKSDHDSVENSAAIPSVPETAWQHLKSPSNNRYGDFEREVYIRKVRDRMHAAAVEMLDSARPRQYVGSESEKSMMDTQSQFNFLDMDNDFIRSKGTTTTDVSGAPVRPDGSNKVQMFNSDSQSPTLTGTVASAATEPSVTPSTDLPPEADRPATPRDFRPIEATSALQQTLQAGEAILCPDDGMTIEDHILLSNRDLGIRKHWDAIHPEREGGWGTAALAKVLESVCGSRDSVMDTGSQKTVDGSVEKTTASTTRTTGPILRGPENPTSSRYDLYKDYFKASEDGVGSSRMDTGTINDATTESVHSNTTSSETAPGTTRTSSKLMDSISRPSYVPEKYHPDRVREMLEERGYGLSAEEEKKMLLASKLEAKSSSTNSDEASPANDQKLTSHPLATTQAGEDVNNALPIDVESDMDSDEDSDWDKLETPGGSDDDGY